MKYKFLFSLLIVALTTSAQSLPELIKNGYAKLTLNNFEGAEQDFAAAIRVNDPVITAYLDKLKKYSTLNEYQRSTSDMPDGFIFNHDYALPYYGHGLALEGIGKQIEALSDYQKAINIDPNYAEAICERGVVLIKTGNKDKGCIDLLVAKKQGSEKAKDLFEKNACTGMSIFFIKSGNTKLDGKDYQGAIADYTNSIQLNADSAEAFFKRAQCYVALKKHTKAIEDYTTALEIKPNMIKTHYLMGISYLAVERYKEAFDDFTSIIKENPNDYDTYMQRAAACEGMTNFRSAIYDYSEAIRLKPKDGTAYYRRAVAKRDANAKDATSCTDFKIAAALGNEEAKTQAQYCQ